jgi:hypothetical protein
MSSSISVPNLEEFLDSSLADEFIDLFEEDLENQEKSALIIQHFYYQYIRSKNIKATAVTAAAVAVARDINHRRLTDNEILSHFAALTL